MSLSDCEKCWTTPCVCGWDLRDRTIEYLEEQKRIFEKAIVFIKANPKAKFSIFPENETKDDKRFMDFLHSNSEEAYL
jgi:hypothetical protein